MAWVYANFETLAGTARLEALRNHIAEVEAEVGKDVGADGKSVSHGVLETKLARLYERLRELEKSPSQRRYGGFSNFRYS